MKKLLCLLVMSLFITFGYSCLDEIEALGFTPQTNQYIIDEVKSLLTKPSKTNLNFSFLGESEKIDALIKIIYIFLYPWISIHGPIKNKDYPDVHIKEIDLTGNNLVEIPVYIFDFPDLTLVRFKDNDLPLWRIANIKRSNHRMRFIL